MNFEPQRNTTVPQNGNHVRLVRIDDSGKERVVARNTSKDGTVNHLTLFARLINEHLDHGWPADELVGLRLERYTNGELNGPAAVIRLEDLKVLVSRCHFAALEFGANKDDSAK